MWIEAGQDPATFHTFTLSEVSLVVRATVARRDAEYERQRILAHELAGLIAVGFHNPKDFPEYQPLARLDRDAAGPTEADNAKIRAFFVFHATRASQ